MYNYLLTHLLKLFKDLHIYLIFSYTITNIQLTYIHAYLLIYLKISYLLTYLINFIIKKLHNNILIFILKYLCTYKFKDKTINILTYIHI